MTEIVQPIPARLKNVAVGGHVAGAEDIDAGNGKNQSEVNTSVDGRLDAIEEEIGGGGGGTGDSLSERVTTLESDVSDINTDIGDDNTSGSVKGRIKAIEGKIPSAASSSNKLVDQQQMNSSISTALGTIVSTASSDYNTLAKIETIIKALDSSTKASLDAQDALIAALQGISAVIPCADHTAIASPAANTIYREPDSGGTSFTDWMHDGTTWIPLATYSMPGIDTTVTKNSTNLITSGAVSKAISQAFGEGEEEDVVLTWATQDKQFGDDGFEVSAPGLDISDFIPVNAGDILRIKVNSYYPNSANIYPVYGYASQDANNPIDFWPISLSINNPDFYCYIPSGVNYVRIGDRYTGSHVHSASVKKIKNANSVFTQLSEEVNGKVISFLGFNGVFNNDYVVGTTYKKFRMAGGTADVNYLYLVKCEAGDTFNLNINSPFPCGYSFYSDALVRISGQGTPNAVINKTITAPENAAWLIANTNLSALSGSYIKESDGGMFDGLTGIKVLTQAEYDALTVIVPTILYIIKD